MSITSRLKKVAQDIGKEQLQFYVQFSFKPEDVSRVDEVFVDIGNKTNHRWFKVRMWITTGHVSLTLDQLEWLIMECKKRYKLHLQYKIVSAGKVEDENGNLIDYAHLPQL